MRDSSPATGARFHRLLFVVFLPFALGHFLSLFFRNVNAVLTPYLMAELPLGAERIGLLSSVYFLTLALTQIPVGLCLDRWGPRRTQIAFLSVAVMGTLLFAVARDFYTLFAARALSGIGMAGAFMAAVKAIATAFESRRLPVLNGAMIAVGGLGSMAATSPVEWALHAMSWHELFVWLAGFLMLAIAAVFWLVPPETLPSPPPAYAQPRTLASFIDVWRVPGFRRAISLVLLPHAVAFGVQGVWLGRWISDIGRLDRAATANVLFASMGGIVVGALLVGAMGGWAERRGYRLLDVAGAGVALFVIVQLAAACGFVPLVPMLAVGFSIVGAIGGLEFSLVLQAVPRHLAGRASTMLNLLIFLGSFLVQTLFGLILERWPPLSDLRYPAQAYSAAFGFLALLQLPGLMQWYWQREPSRAAPKPSDSAVR
ncbi:MFS transporter [Trinickia sp. NRRL B-1857]|uniref:MFS transporter n=1 Tax=Trinickia sp. NRRL B-1857 TaxID=3162879 RepID=UPI003D293EF1